MKTGVDCDGVLGLGVCIELLMQNDRKPGRKLGFKDEDADEGSKHGPNSVTEQKRGRVMCFA